MRGAILFAAAGFATSIGAQSNGAIDSASSTRLRQQGKWGSRQVISRDWVARSTARWSTVGDQDYGYFWWHQWVNATTPSGPRRIDMIVATGNGGQKIYIVPSLDLIVVLTGGNYNSQSPALEIMRKDLLPALLNQ
jgi:CubicO group peptidase (beta-lactamase class C family)